MTWRMDSFDPDAWLAEWVRGRFSKQQDEIANAYQTYFNAWQIHPDQQVPFLMDGQMFSAGNTVLGQLARKLKEPNPPPPRKRPPADAAAPARGDAFWSGLSDMHPRSLARSETIKRVAAQKAGLALALQQAQRGRRDATGTRGGVPARQPDLPKRHHGSDMRVAGAPRNCSRSS